jgi:hypothetical protein
VPYKYPYTLHDFWPLFTEGTLWKAFAKANPGEATHLNDHAEAKMNLQPDFIPYPEEHTITGQAVLMVIMTLNP